MTISELVRTDGTPAAEVSLGQLHDAAGQVDEELLPCRVNNPELWFAESPADVEFAKALCLDCPVRALCLDGALERREPWGVWGGQLFLQGVVIPRKRPRGRPRKNESPPEPCTPHTTTQAPHLNTDLPQETATDQQQRVWPGHPAAAEQDLIARSHLSTDQNGYSMTNEPDMNEELWPARKCPRAWERRTSSGWATSWPVPVDSAARPSRQHSRRVSPSPARSEETSPPHPDRG